MAAVVYLALRSHTHTEAFEKKQKGTRYSFGAVAAVAVLTVESALLFTTQSHMLLFFVCFWKGMHDPVSGQLRCLFGFCKQWQMFGIEGIPILGGIAADKIKK